ncbi:gag-pol [Symbiodinium natans]|uniref:Gag-pol protein n=1 Tax=Symbiodinium natans TaxID=878477 RepID=A0A812QIU7_9DINO|nr:gag-pol [Symbiodinium natans]
MAPCSAEDRWRDLLPLPLLEPDKHEHSRNEFLKESACVRRHRARRKDNLDKTNEVIHALNAMAGFDVPCTLKPTPNQAHSQSSLLRRVAHLPRSQERVFQREAIRELLLDCPSSPYVSDGGGTGSVRAYQRDLVSLPESGAEPLEATALIDDQGREILERFESTMFVGEDVSHGSPIKPYMDDTLRSSPKAYAQFISDIFERGMIDFDRTATSIITPFFVSKKSGKLRLVLDCRASNQQFDRPPDIALAAGYTFAQLELPEGESLFVAQSDVRDYFYSIGLPQGLRRYFALPPIPASALPAGVGVIAESEGELWYPRMKVVPMGWSWAMWIAQRIHQHQASVALACSPDQVLVDGRPPPSLEAGSPLLIPYADNLNVCGTNQAAVQSAKDKVVEQLRSVGFRVHEEEDASLRVQALGFVIDGEKGEVHPIAARRDKVRLGLLWLSKRPKVTGRAIERIVGHCVHLFMLRRDLLSIFRSVYDFKIANYHKPCRLWRTAAEECRIAAALILTCYADLRKPWCPTITASDASLSGTAVAALTVESGQVQTIGVCREMWRFKSKDPLAKARDAALCLDPFVHHETVMSLDPAERDPFQLNLDFQHVPVQIACHPEWKLQFACRMHKPEHITLLEGRGTVQAVRHKMRVEGNYGMKHLHLGDNLGMVLAFDRGRAKAVPLLICCRRATAFAIAGDCVFTHRWIPSEHNAADAGSRQWEQEKPSETAAKSRSKEAVTSLCYPKSKSCFSKEQGRELLWGVLAGAPTKRSLRKALQGPDEATRASKRQAVVAAGKPRNRNEGHTFLETAAVAPRTSEEYLHKWNLFESFCKTQKLKLRKEDEVDYALNLFLNQAFLEGWDISEGVKCMAAVTDRWPALSGRGQLPRTRRSMQGWRNLDPGVTRPPLAWPLVALIALTVLQADQFVACMAILFMFATYVRPGEVFEIRRQDLVKSRSLGQVWSVNLHPSDDLQESKVEVSNETILLDNKEIPWLGAALECMTAISGAALFPTNYTELLDTWHRALKQLGLGFKFAVPHQLRHSGASWDRFKNYRSLLEVKHRGRWAADSSLKRYEQHAMVAQQFEKLAPALKRRAQAAPATLQAMVLAKCGLKRLGIPCEAWDIDYGEACNVLTPKVAAVLLHRIAKGEFSAVHLGMPCITWSRARRDDGRGPRALRDDHAGLFGLPSLMPWERRKVQEGNQLLEFSLQVIACCQKLGLPWSLENPLTSRVWLVPAMQRLQTQGATFVNTCYCMYGMPWRKATAFLCGNFNLSLRTCGCSFRCCERSGKAHVHLVGRDNRGRWLTRLAQPYPHELCSHYALQLLLRLKHTPRSDMDQEH